MSLLDCVYLQHQDMAEFTENQAEFTMTNGQMKTESMDEESDMWAAFPHWAVAQGSSMTFGDLLGVDNNHMTEESNCSLGYVGSTTGSLGAGGVDLKGRNSPFLLLEEDFSFILDKEVGEVLKNKEQLENSDGYASASPTENQWAVPVVVPPLLPPPQQQQPVPTPQTLQAPLSFQLGFEPGANMEVDDRNGGGGENAVAQGFESGGDDVEEIKLSELLRPTRQSEGQVQMQEVKKEQEELTRNKGPAKKVVLNKDKSKNLLMERDLMRLMLEAYMKEHDALKAKHEQLRRDALSRGLGHLLMYVKDLTNDTAAPGQRTK